MRARSQARVRKVSRQLKDDDCADGRSSAAEAADGGDRFAVEQIRRQHIGDGGVPASRV